VDKLLLNRKELAQSLGISQRTVSRLLSAGKLPKPARLGRRLVWRVRDIQEWADKLADNERRQV